MITSIELLGKTERNQTEKETETQTAVVSCKISNARSNG